MSRRRLYAVVAGLGVTASVALALLFGVFRAGPSAVTVVEPEAPASSVDAETANEVASASGGGYGEGIKVHGRWTLEVREPDGTLVSRHQFDNALTSTGALQIVRYLNRTHSVGSSGIRIINFNSPGPCPALTSPIGFCLITESDVPGSSPALFKNLTKEIPNSGPNVNKLVLSGFFTAPATGTSSIVEWLMVACSPSTSPADCHTAAPNIVITVTHHSPVQVLAGQQVLVTLVIHFSPPGGFGAQ